MSYGGLIRLLPDMEPAESLATLVHELAHEMLHRAERRTSRPKPFAKQKPKPWPLWFVTRWGLKPEPVRVITSSFTTAMQHC